jgi:hypothetical protein
MMNEMKFNLEKPDDEKGIEDFKIFKAEIKTLLTKGKLKIVEKFRVFAFIITDPSPEERKNVTTLLKKREIVEIPA